MFSSNLFQFCAVFTSGFLSGYLYQDYIFRKMEERNLRVEEWVNENKEELKKKWEDCEPPQFLSDEEVQAYQDSLWWWQKLW